MNETTYLGTISVRLPVSLIEAVDKRAGVDFPNKQNMRSEEMRELLQLGLQVKTVMQLRKDPKQKKMFEKNVQDLMNQESVQHTLETMDDATVDAVIFYAKALKDKRFQQSIIELR